MRGAHVYARGGLLKGRLVLRAGAHVPAGRYTLIVVSGRSTRSFTVTLA